MQFLTQPLKSLVTAPLYPALKDCTGKVVTGVLARIAVQQCVWVVHSELFTRPLALWRLAAVSRDITTALGSHVQ